MPIQTRALSGRVSLDPALRRRPSATSFSSAMYCCSCSSVQKRFLVSLRKNPKSHWHTRHVPGFETFISTTILIYLSADTDGGLAYQLIDYSMKPIFRRVASGSPASNVGSATF